MPGWRGRTWILFLDVFLSVLIRTNHCMPLSSVYSQHSGATMTHRLILPHHGEEMRFSVEKMFLWVGSQCFPAGFPWWTCSKTLIWREVLFSETLVWETSLCRGLKYLRGFASILESPRPSLTHPRDVMLMTWSPQTHAELRGSPPFFCFLQKALGVRIIGFSILPSH